MLQQYTFLVSN